MKLVISYQFLCAEHEFDVQIEKISSSFFVITIWKKLSLHNEMHYNALHFFYKSHVTEIKLVISYQFLFVEHE